MTDYKAPLREIQFLRNEVLDFPAHYKNLPGFEEATPDLEQAILEEAAKLAENVIAPLNRIGDIQGCTLKDKVVTTPDGFKEAYRQYVAGGWPSLSAPAQWGGQNLPASMETLVTELFGQANHAWTMYPGLATGAKATILEHGSAQQQATYLPKLVNGEWLATMCLTEPHCGSDLGLLKTKAEPQSDGSYKLTGTKIFISSGEHDLSENIIHIVLARLPDAPAGTKGISLFIVPKFLTDESGKIGNRNDVFCGSLEHKMGIHGNATCVMNFDGAKGFLIGPENRGLNCMFTFMNFARIGVTLEGFCHIERAYQGAVAYAKERLQMRALSGPKNPKGPADPIIVHPDVRRMLLTIKAFAEAGRAFIHYETQVADLSRYSNDEQQRNHADALLGLLTPIGKAFTTEVAIESASLGMQVFGGHGYIAEWGMEQNLRDARITSIYEGTTGIQALDLIGRKVLKSGGELLKVFTRDVLAFCDESSEAEMKPYTDALRKRVQQWETVTGFIGGKAMENVEEVGAASVDYLMLSGYICYAYFWAKMIRTAQQKIKAGHNDAFYHSKVNTGKFYFQRILPRCDLHQACIESGAANLMDLSEDQF